MTAAPGLILAAPSSGSGKTLTTLGLLAHLAGRGMRVASAKVGPDYIDPAFHAAAGGRVCVNLDSWAMRSDTLNGLIAGLSENSDVVVCEGVMGLFDGADVEQGAPDGSTAEIAALTGWPVVLVIDARGMAGSAAAVLAGFARVDPAVKVAGVVFNQVSGEKHRRMIAQACARLCPETKLLGFMPRIEKLVVPSRHLGLVQACEHPDLPDFLAAAAQAVGEHVQVDELLALACPAKSAGPAVAPLAPLGQRIAAARDQSFAFSYASVLEGWRCQGAEITFFSPLADQAPDGDSVYLPGGYPELYAARLAGAHGFIAGMRRIAQSGGAVFGECGGYMVMGETLQDSEGAVHPMLGLLPLRTSFAKRKLHLGYRRAILAADCALGAAGAKFRGHEFHFAVTLPDSAPADLVRLQDASGRDLGMAGHRRGSAFGSFFHLIDRA